MSKHINDRVRYPLAIPNFPDFNTNPNATKEEQNAVFLNTSLNTGPVDHGYTGNDAGVAADSDLYTEIIENPGSLVIAPNQSNSGSTLQSVKLRSGANVFVSRKDGVISGGNELVPGGMGMSPNVLLNLPSSDGTYQGRPVWQYSSMEIIDALPIYQANRARMLDRLADIVESGEYDFFLISIPSNNVDATIAWKDTYRTQLSVPPESLLVMILTDTVVGSEPPTL